MVPLKALKSHPGNLRHQDRVAVVVSDWIHSNQTTHQLSSDFNANIAEL